MDLLPVIPSRTCRHHRGTNIPPAPDPGTDLSPEQAQFFQDIALWMFRHNGRVQNPEAEIQSPRFRQLIDEISGYHRKEHRFLRLTGDDLQYGVSARCKFCEWMTEWLEDEYGPPEGQAEHFVLISCNETVVRFSLFQLQSSWFNAYALDEVLGTCLAMKAYFLSWAPSEQGQLMTYDASLDNIMLRARTWLDQSIERHTRCGPHNHAFTPTRLLEVSVDGEMNGLRLIEPKEPLPSYATLSYCWGIDTQPVRLTCETLQRYRQNIDTSVLPQTLKDAVAVTIGLGLRHLWVDALCIIQNDETDKDREIDRMGDIFEGSTITIVASKALSVTSGFLDRPVNLERHGLPWNFEPSQELGIELDNHDITSSNTIVLFMRRSWRHDDEEPLSLRGWALQERLLSRRTLTFGRLAVTWACQELPHSLSAFRERHKDADQCDEVLEDHPLFWPARWAQVVNDFSDLSLRNPGDRLPALAGIAQRWASGLRDTYVAGLWRSSLPETLVWSVMDRAPPLKDTDSTHAPSWSWAATTGPVLLSTNPSRTSVKYAECINVELNCRNDNWFGAITSGIITLRGVLTPVQLILVPEVKGYKEYQLKVAHDVHAETMLMNIRLDRDLPAASIEPYVLPISGSTRVDGVHGNDMQVLIITQNANGTFTRLGAGFIFYNARYRKMPSAAPQRLISGPQRIVKLV